MSLSTVVRKSAPGARGGPVATHDVADESIADALAARTFSKQLDMARRAALSEPATAAEVLSDWMSQSG